MSVIARAHFRTSTAYSHVCILSRSSISTRKLYQQAPPTSTSTMASKALVNPATQRKKATAMSSFERFLGQNELSLGVVHGLVSDDSSGKVLVRLLDRYVLSLATGEGERGKRLAKTSVLNYFSHVKNHFYNLNPAIIPVCERQLSGMHAIVDKFCTRSGGAAVKQAPPCTKSDLRALLEAIYASAASEVDFIDGALLVLMWHVSGRSSDMISLSRNSFAVHPGGALTVRLGRMKTTLEQGLALYVDKDDYRTCPIHALALSFLMDTFPSELLFRHLPRGNPYGDSPDDESELMNLLDALQVDVDPTAPAAKRSAPGVHSYVNRVLRQAFELPLASSVRRDITSHSFRRSGAQAANVDANVSLQWIFDRGGWQLSSMNKGFMYAFNTTTEDQQVARVLSGWRVSDTAWYPSFEILGSTSKHMLVAFRDRLYAHAIGRDLPELNLRVDVLELFVATMIYHYPDSSKLCPLLRARLTACMEDIGGTEHELLAWSLMLRHSRQSAMEVSRQATPTPPALENKLVDAMLQEQLELMRQLVQQNAQLSARIAQLELGGSRSRTETAIHRSPLEQWHNETAACARDAGSCGEEGAVGACDRAARRRKAMVKTPLAIWIEWYTALATNTIISRRRKHEYRHLIAYMQLFLEEGYVLDPSLPSYQNDVQRTGTAAEMGLMRFLQYRELRCKAYGTVTKALRHIESSGALDGRVRAFTSLRLRGLVTDPSSDYPTWNASQ
jgi:hypothetical protein